MRIGIDFDNTIICYDNVFCDLAKTWQLVDDNYQGTKRELRDHIRLLPEGDIIWQRMQGQTYGPLVCQAQMFEGFKEFVAACHANPTIELFIVSHKTEFGHFDESKTNLRDAARAWMRSQQLFDKIKEENVFFETTREEKIDRIKTLQCTHFIDDLVEVLEAPQFPRDIKRFLFQPLSDDNLKTNLKHYSHWDEINHDIFVAAR